MKAPSSLHGRAGKMPASGAKSTKSERSRSPVCCQERSFWLGAFPL